MAAGPHGPACEAGVMAGRGWELGGPPAGLDLRRCYWIGGSPCAGKSSLAAMLADRHDLLHVECDAGTQQRLVRMSGQRLAAYTELSALGVCERLSRPPQWQAERELAFYREQFGFLLAELAGLPAGRPALVEGADLLPDLVRHLGVPMDRAVWMVPTPEFQRRHYAMREWVPAYLQGCADPERAFDNWMLRDVLFAEQVRELAEAAGGRVIVVDSAASLEAAVRTVERHFGLTAPRP